jgi:fibrillarin-like rRNA methylase
VFITASGKLGVLASSERYKTDIQSMDVDASKLEKLRPVTFHLKTDAEGPLQYGLIAEEVDKIYPDLVVRNAAGIIVERSEVDNPGKEICQSRPVAIRFAFPNRISH